MVGQGQSWPQGHSKSWVARRRHPHRLAEHQERRNLDHWFLPPDPDSENPTRESHPDSLPHKGPHQNLSPVPHLDSGDTPAEWSSATTVPLDDLMEPPLTEAPGPHKPQKQLGAGPHSGRGAKKGPQGQTELGEQAGPPPSSEPTDSGQGVRALRGQSLCSLSSGARLWDFGIFKTARASSHPTPGWETSCSILAPRFVHLMGGRHNSGTKRTCL